MADSGVAETVVVFRPNIEPQFNLRGRQMPAKTLTGSFIASIGAAIFVAATVCGDKTSLSQ